MNGLMRFPQLFGAFALIGASSLQAQNPAAPAAMTPRLDSPQASVIVATLQPRTPAIAKNGHATNRVLIYLDDGVMTRKEGDQSTTIEFRRGDVRWRPASGAYVAENISDHPIRILEIDLKGPPAWQSTGDSTRSGDGRSPALQGRVRERVGARAPHPFRRS